MNFSISTITGSKNFLDGGYKYILQIGMVKENRYPDRKIAELNCARQVGTAGLTELEEALIFSAVNFIEYSLIMQ